MRAARAPTTPTTPAFTPLIDAALVADGEAAALVALEACEALNIVTFRMHITNQDTITYAELRALDACEVIELITELSEDVTEGTGAAVVELAPVLVVVVVIAVLVETVTLLTAVLVDTMTDEVDSVTDADDEEPPRQLVSPEEKGKKTSVTISHGCGRGKLTTRKDLESGGLVDRTRGVTEVEPERGAYNRMEILRHCSSLTVDRTLTDWLVGYPCERRRGGIRGEVFDSRRTGGVAGRQTKENLEHRRSAVGRARHTRGCKGLVGDNASALTWLFNSDRRLTAATRPGDESGLANDHVLAGE